MGHNAVCTICYVKEDHATTTGLYFIAHKLHIQTKQNKTSAKSREERLNNLITNFTLPSLYEWVGQRGEWLSVGSFLSVIVTLDFLKPTLLVNMAGVES